MDNLQDPRQIAGFGNTPPRWKPYPAYKPSGVDWLGEIPTHWKVKRIKYIAPVVTEKLHEKPEDLPYIGLENVESGTGRLLMEAPVESVDSVVGVFKRGDVLFGKLRPYLAKVVNSSFEGVCTSELVVLRPPTEGGQYLSYQLLSRDLIRLLTSFTYGTKMPRVSPEQIAGLAVAVPPTDEQRTISAFLDRETAKIDALVAKKERLIELLQEKRAALITHAVTKGVNPSAPMKPSGVEWLGEIPAHWGIRRLKFLTSQVTVGIVVTPAKYYVDEGVPCLRSLNVREEQIQDQDLVFISPESNEQHRKSKIFAGDLVSVRTGQPGATSVVDERFDGANCIDLIITRRSKVFDPFFMAYVANSCLAKNQFESLSVGAIQQHFNIDTAKNLLVVVPSLREQAAILAHLNRETARIDALIGKLRDHIDRLREYRGAVISAAVTGRIDVRGEVTP